MRRTYALLEVRNLFISKRVSLGDDGNEVDFGVQSAHHLDVQGLERVASRLNKVYASMHAVVNNVHPVHLVFCVKVGIKALLNVFHDRSPRVVVVHKVAESGSVDDGETKANTVLLNVSANGLDAHRLGRKVERWLFALLGRI